MPTPDETGKAARAAGRDQGRSVRRYLEALEAHKPRRRASGAQSRSGSGSTPSKPNSPTTDALKRLHLIQERLDLQAALERTDAGTDLTELEADFVAVAASCGNRKGRHLLSLARARRPASVLTLAGINRTG